jgi:hypothetical protein
VASIRPVPIPCIRTLRAIVRVTSSCASIRAVAIAEPAAWPASKGFLIISEHARVSRGSPSLHPIVRSSKSETSFRGNPRVGVLIASTGIRQVQIAKLSSCHDYKSRSPHVFSFFRTNRIGCELVPRLMRSCFLDSPCRALIHANRCRTCKHADQA